MRLKPTELIALTALLLGICTFMGINKKKKWRLPVAGLFLAAFLVLITFSLSTRDATEAGNTAINNSPPTTHGDSSPINQGSGTQNIGMSESFVRDLLRDKAIAANTELAVKYPAGYVMLGVANGKLIYEAHPIAVKMQVEWDSAQIQIVGTNIEIKLPNASITDLKRNNTFTMGNVRTGIPAIENAPIRSGLFVGFGVSMFFELLDLKKQIFLIGFKEDGP